MPIALQLTKTVAEPTATKRSVPSPAYSAHDMDVVRTSSVALDLSRTPIHTSAPEPTQGATAARLSGRGQPEMDCSCPLDEEECAAIELANARTAEPGVDTDALAVAPGDLTLRGIQRVGSSPHALRHLPAPELKLNRGTTCDAQEREADRIADYVTRMPAPATPHAMERHDLQRNLAHPPSVANQVPATVHEALRSPGEPLDAATRGYFEPRFGYDFSGVRVHSDPAAEESARAMGARAYTAGSHVMFAHGERPQTSSGYLLAHELAHVVQQNQSDLPPKFVQCSPDNEPEQHGRVPEKLLLHSVTKGPKRLNSDEGIVWLAANPYHAALEWKRLKPQSQIGVAIYMANFYGAPFAKRFLDFRKAAKVPEVVFEQVGSDITSAQLMKRGFHFAGEQPQLGVEIWFHPSGNRIHRIIPSVSAPAVETAPALEPELEESTAPVELAELTEGQRKALILLQRMEHMNDGLIRLLDEEPPRTAEFMNKALDFRTLREEFSELVLDDNSVSEPEFSSILIDRKNAVETFVQLRNRAYGTDIGDWEQIERPEQFRRR